MIVERSCHEFCVGDADTEAQSTSPKRVKEQGVNFVQNQPCANVIPGVDAIEVLDAITAALPNQAVQVHRVGNAKVLERAQQSAVDGVG